MQIRGLRPVLQDAVCDSARIEVGAPGSDGLIQDLVRLIEPHAQKAVRASGGGYNPRWASSVAAGKKALAANSKALDAFTLFCARVMGGMEPV